MNSPVKPATPSLAHFLQVSIQVNPPQLVGNAGQGDRKVVVFAGGEFSGTSPTGDTFSGLVLTGGDWLQITADGNAIIDARYTLKTSSGALIYVQDRGLRTGPAEVLEQLAKGEAVDPAEYYCRTSTRFETGDSNFYWINSTVVVGSGARFGNNVVMDFYRVL